MGSLCLLLFFLFWVSQSLTAPLRQLKEKLEKRGLESNVDLEVVTDNNEVTMLSETIENILNQIHIQNQKTDFDERTCFESSYEHFGSTDEPAFFI